MKISSALGVNSSAIRTRTFTLGGQTFKVRVPLASEMDAISRMVEEADWTAKHAEMMAPLLEKRDTLEGDDIVFKDDDAIVAGKSVKELAQMTVKAEARILHMVRLLVPADEGFDMAQVSYADIEAEWPFSVQMDLVKKINEVISPGYEDTRKN